MGPWLSWLSRIPTLCRHSITLWQWLPTGDQRFGDLAWSLTPTLAPAQASGHGCFEFLSPITIRNSNFYRNLMPFHAIPCNSIPLIDGTIEWLKVSVNGTPVSSPNPNMTESHVSCYSRAHILGILGSGRNRPPLRDETKCCLWPEAWR